MIILVNINIAISLENKTFLNSETVLFLDPTPGYGCRSSRDTLIVQVWTASTFLLTGTGNKLSL